MKKQSSYPLMDELVSSTNIDRAIEKVRKNKGASGIDQMTVSEVKEHLNQYRQPFIQKLRAGTYRPQPAKRVEIDKKNGKKRKLSIPVVRDRVVQQMILQVILQDILQDINLWIDPTFSKNSYGFRPGKSCQQAINKAAQYYEEGNEVVVDCDLKSYFDTINHQKLMHQMQWYIPGNGKYRQLKARGASHQEAMRYANSRKSYGRLSESQLLHRILTKEKFKQRYVGRGEIYFPSTLLMILHGKKLKENTFCFVY